MVKLQKLAKLDIISDFINGGLPQEIVMRLDAIWGMTKTIAGEIVNVGQIILTKIWEFVKENQNFAIGVAIGAAIGSLVNLIPFLGQLLSPIAISIGAIIGGVVGERLDRMAKGETVTEKSGIFESAIMLAKKFFQLFSEIFNGLKTYFI